MFQMKGKWNGRERLLRDFQLRQDHLCQQNEQSERLENL